MRFISPGPCIALLAVLSSLLVPVLLSQFYHSTTRIPVRWLDRVLVTPQVHRIHHSVLPEHQDKNFADAQPIFDIVFGTYHRPAPDESPHTGLYGGEPPPTRWWRAQLEPVANLFIRQREADENH